MCNVNRFVATASLFFVFLAVSAGVTGCVVSPTQGALLGADPATGFATLASAPIRVNAFNFTTGLYELVGSGAASSSPTIAAGTLCSNSPALYYYSVPYSVTADDLDHHVFPDPVGKLQLVQVQPDGQKQVLFSSANRNPIQCVTNNVKPGCDFYNVTYNICGYSLTEISFYTLG